MDKNSLKQGIKLCLASPVKAIKEMPLKNAVLSNEILMPPKAKRKNK